MREVSVPEHQWRKQQRKRRFKNKKRDRKRNNFKHNHQLDRKDDFADADEINEIMEREFNRR